MPKVYVYVGLYEHKHGSDIRVFSTKEGVDRWRQSIANEWWEKEMDDKPRPADHEEMANAYFDIVGDSAGEFFTRKETKVEEIWEA